MSYKNIIAALLILLLASCNNQEIIYPDYATKAGYFPYQTPIRTLILGKYEQGINENDNEQRFEIGMTMSGVYENNEDRRVHFELDNSLLDNVANVQALSQEYYTIETESPLTIPAGDTKGRITVQLNNAFFNDSLSFAPQGEVNYVVPIRLTQLENLDTLLSGESVVENPDPVDPSHWNVLPQDYTLYGIKFINKYHGHYLRRGVDVMTDASGNVVENEYHSEYVVKDEVVMVSTSGHQSVTLENTVRRGEKSSPGNLLLELVFGNDDQCSIRSAEGDPYNISGSGTFVEEADEWGGKARDVIYLDYNYTDAANNETHAVKDTLVIRDRAVTFEEFAIELNENE
ncbi:hypothetical protein OKW21_001835 [Catalinimonas alkaloidigena]|uniref:DUF5627 domain-containing protein n=1 Tax=Catalinimonas alkaloidigena TaxID=1075417 RepID=UPI0024056ADF|nr:DUF5627 domain-containing protein [Catalinimonas alkaloidigena]MDF9796572.1 hypothetical protein [Catalinimonas alkaloidigena]